MTTSLSVSITESIATTGFDDAQEEEKIESPVNNAVTRKQGGQPVHEFKNVEEYLNVIDGNFCTPNADQPIVVVKYYANYCQICKRVGMKYKKIATDESGHNEILFTKVESSTLSSDTLRSLGVTKFPFIQIYRKGQCVASFSTGPSHLFVRTVRDTIRTCKNRSEQEWKVFANEFANEIQCNRETRKELLESLTTATTAPSKNNNISP